MTPLVINLRRNHRRLAHMQQELARVGVDFERLEAVEATSLPPSTLAELAATYGTRGHPHPLGTGQIGSLLSHAEAWRRIAEGPDKWGVVMEDDIHVTPELKTLLHFSAWIPDSANIVRLETTSQGVWLGKRSRARSVNVEFELAEIAGPSWGCAAYVIERRTARWLASLPPSLAAPADKLLFSKGTPIADALSTWQVVPAPCVQDKFHPTKKSRIGFDSDIEAAKPAAASAIEQTTASIKRFGRVLIGKSLVPFGSEYRVAD